MSTSLSISLAMTMAASSKTPAEVLPRRVLSNYTTRLNSTCPKEVSIYKGVSDRPLGWKPRRLTRTPCSNPMARDILRKWDGTGTKIAEWDGFRRDLDLWFPEGDCLVHLYAYGQSRRGPSFKVPLSSLCAANCQPLLDRFMVDVEEYQPSSQWSRQNINRNMPRQYQLYIPAPTTLEGKQAFLYHTATRNFFAWVFGKPIVGHHLGGALVALLNTMNEFRDPTQDNTQTMMDFMDEEGYGDMKNRPDYALGILYFAEHFQFRDLWLDAFAHCVGMNERLGTSPGYEFISRPSRGLVIRARIEMDTRLESCTKKLETFLSDDLLEADTLPAGARAHLDKFRSFLHSYFVGKFGYYPPTSSYDTRDSTFPKHVYGQMCTEFEKLYEFLMDSQFTILNPLLPARSGGICVEHVLKNFDKRQKYAGLFHPVPLLPEVVAPAKPKFRKFGFQPKADKMKSNPRLVTFASLSHATNRKQHLLGCPLVRAYQGFEKECVFSSSPLFVDKDEKLSQKEARKVRWILIYSTLQTLLSATRIPNQVTDINVPYNISILTTGCPPWKDERSDETIVDIQPQREKETFSGASTEAQSDIAPLSPPEININQNGIIETSQQSKTSKQILLMSSDLTKRACSALEDTPKLQHSRTREASYHEILVEGYGNGANNVNITAGITPGSQKQSLHTRKLSSESGSSSVEDLSFRWSNCSLEVVDANSPSTSVAPDSRRSSKISMETLKKNYSKAYPNPEEEFFDLDGVPDSLWIEAVDESCAWEPEPLEPQKAPREQCMHITAGVKVEWEEPKNTLRNCDLLNYLHNPNPCPMVAVRA